MIGYKYFKKKGIMWRHIHQALVPLSMPHLNPHINVREARVILQEEKSLLIRWDTCFDKFETGEWWHVIKDIPENLDSLSSNTRSKVRRGLRSFKCRPCEKQLIISEGYLVYKSAFERYETFEKCLSESDFVEAVLKLPEQTEFWSVIDVESSEVVAFSENIVRDDVCFYNTIWFQPKALRRYSSYALFHEMNKFYLNERGCIYVSDGARSVSHETNIHDFLQSKFHFRKAYSKLNVAYSPIVATFVTILYPFRTVLKKLKGSHFSKINILLDLEFVRRSCEKQADG